MMVRNREQANNGIREELRAKGIRHWQLAKRLGVSEQTLVRWMREPLPHDVEQRMTKIIVNWN